MRKAPSGVRECNGHTGTDDRDFSMITGLEIENFKAFCGRTKIPLAPITLVFGENSAGKSSILQLLYLLKQTESCPDPSMALMPRTDYGYVDFGSFREMVFDHKPERGSLCIRLDLDFSKLRTRRLLNWLDSEKSVGVELQFRLWESTEQVVLDKLLCWVGGSADPALEFRASKPLPEHGVGWGLRCSHLACTGRYWMKSYEWLKDNRDSIVQDLIDRQEDNQALIDPIMTKLMEKQIEDNNLQPNQNGAYEVTWSSFTNDGCSDEAQGVLALSWQQEGLGDAIEFLKNDFDYNSFVLKLTELLNFASIEVMGFIPLSHPRDVTLDIPTDEGPHKITITLSEGRRGYIPNLVFGGMGTWAALLPQPNPFDVVAGIGELLKDVLKSYVPLASRRQPPQRYYPISGANRQALDWTGGSMADYLATHPDLVKSVNMWLNRLGVDYALQVRELAQRPTGIVELRLRDTRRPKSTYVNLCDLGYGVSQLLPVLIQSLAGRNNLISIEEPESNVHPRLQAELGTLLAECIKPPFDNRFLVETHSEHLILRLQKLVRQKELAPDDVCVLYVQRGKKGSTVRRLQLDEEGDFLDDWPGGFFPERLHELRD